MATAAGEQHEGLDPRAKSAIWGAFIGFFVDMFDIYLPVVVLQPALIYFSPPEISTVEKSLISGSIFAATLIGRPLGSFIFGHFADAIGRRRTAIISVSGFGVATLLMALLPGYRQWGIAAVIIFVVLRLVDGVFLGGEYTSANPLAMEYSPKEKRGFYSAFVMSGYPVAYAAISAITLGLLFLLPAGDINSPYVQWGWRIPFLIGAALAFAFLIYLVRSVSESELFEESGGSESPLKELFRGQNLRNFLQVFVLMTGFWFTLQPISAILPERLADPVGLSKTNVTITLVVANIVLVGGYFAAGVISQRIGRRPFLIAAGLVGAVVGTFFYYLLLSTAPQSLLLVIVLATIATLLATSQWGISTTYITERFHTGVRASGFGIGYSLAVVLPSFYAYYQAALAYVMPFEYTVLVLLAVGGLLVALGAALGPETKDVDFEEEVREAPEADGVPAETSPAEPRTAPGAGGS
jgi:MFS family permease